MIAILNNIGQALSNVFPSGNATASQNVKEDNFRKQVYERLRAKVGEEKATKYFNKFPVEFIQAKLQYVFAKNKNKPIENLERYITAIFEKCTDFDVQMEMNNPSMTNEQRQEEYHRSQESERQARHEAGKEESRKFLLKMEDMKRLADCLPERFVERFEKEVIEGSTLLTGMYSKNNFDSLIILAHLAKFLEDIGEL